MDKIKEYVEIFNSNDEENVVNYIDNVHAYDWLKEEIPHFFCPDKEIERTYYFRWWTYRKHIKNTPEGFVVTEFLPKVYWSGKYNTINAPTAHHLTEGRWLKNAKTYMKEYAYFFFNNPEKSHHYSNWLITSLYALSSVTGDFKYDETFIDRIKKYYERWEREHGLKNGMFYSYDNYDAMECSISGRTMEGVERKGVRPTLNSYMCADALAISKFASIVGDEKTANEYLQKHEKLKKLINENLFKDGFYRAFHYDGDDFDENIFDNYDGEKVREEIGYIPWMFSIPPKNREHVFDLLLDEKCFYTPYGIATADKSHEKYLYEVNHECLWNGYVWPYATSQTLTALLKVIHEYNNDEKYRDEFIELFTQYAKSHKRVKEDGQVVDWIDEVRHPQRDEWSSREVLKNWGWKESKGGYERGKDYNHSTFCDLVLSGIVGIDTSANTLKVNPIIPKDWDWFKVENLHYRGKTYTIIYDKYGDKFNKGKGLVVNEQ